MGWLLRTERELWKQGFVYVAGCDEVGVGPLAGPVVAAAVIVSPARVVRGVDDSKTLTPPQRKRLANEIRATALAWAIGVASVEEIDELNVYRAALNAMQRAILQLPLPPDFVVVDGRRIPGISAPQLPLVDGDARSYSVAAASIVAKVYRDELMCEYDSQYPCYGFAQNAGYGTPSHLAALHKYGPCPIHRKSFAPVRQLSLFPRPAVTADRTTSSR